jgi:hypothetical protein
LQTKDFRESMRPLSLAWGPQPLSVRVTVAAICSILLLAVSEYTRRFCEQRADLLQSPGLPDSLYSRYQQQLNIFHPASMFLWFVSLAPFLLIPQVLSVGRNYLVAGLGIAAIVTAVFWIGKHFELKWVEDWFIETLTLTRGITLAVVGLPTICCLYFLLSDPQTTLREIRKQINKMASDKGEHHER